MRLPQGPRYTVKKGVIFICVSILITLAYPIGRLFSRSEGETIKTLVYPQGKENLKGAHLAQMLNLSVDDPTTGVQFDERGGEETLRSYPMVKEAVVKKLGSGALYVDVTLRTPLVLVGNAPNWALDELGVLFPLSPFFTPKKLSTVLLHDSVKERLEPAILDLTLDLVRQLQNEGPCTIDLSRALLPTAAEQEIIITLQNNQILRLCTDEYVRQLKNYRALKQQMDLNNSIIDLRIVDLAFLRKGEPL